MQVFSSSDHHAHHGAEFDGGTLIPSWECPERADIVDAALRADHEFNESFPLDWPLVARVHDAGYLSFLEGAWARWQTTESSNAAIGTIWPTRGFRTDRVPEDLTAQLGFYSFAIDCSIVEGTWRAIRSSAQLAQSATHAVIGGERVAFGLCRPPGHHATADQFGGYCYLNNAAIAAQQFLDSGKARVAVVDVDYHHGNGTQSIFYERDDVVFCSIHADPRQEFPYFSGYADETGRGDGEGFNHNEPLVLGTGFDAWSAALDRCLARLTDLGCDAMIVSLGVDTFELDPISTFTLTHDDYPKMGEQLASVGLPTSILLEGGYAVEDIGINVAGVLQGFENR